MVILVTGAAGYIGSHCVLDLLQSETDVVMFDNLSTGNQEVIDTLIGFNSGCVKGFVDGDLRDIDNVNEVFKKFDIDSVIHFAALSQVEESIQKPELYFENNVEGSRNLLDAMVKNNVKHIIFSSTASVYGEPKSLPIDENHPNEPMSVYGKTKLEVEKLLDEYDAKYGIKSVRLRYFNVIGAHFSGAIGENHNPETHLVPNVLKSVSGQQFRLYGTDYDTKDGTCVRDYVDVQDIAKAHKLALEYLKKNNKTDVFNLGSSEGYSVKEIFAVCEKVSGKKINIEKCDRRVGDVVKLIASSQKAKELLGWECSVPLKTSIKNAWTWEQKLIKSID